MEKFIQFHLKELWTQQETKNLIEELSSRITDHRGRVHQLLRSEPLRHPEVVPLVLVGMAADRPLKCNFFPGLLEGLLGSLGIAAPGEDNPPTSSREGAGCLWSSAIHEAISQIEQKPPQGLKVKIPLRLLKCSSKAMTSSSKDGATPSKVWKELEANETEATASTGPSEAALRKAQFELYKKDLPEVQEVRAQILGLNEGEKATQEDLDSSPAFHLRWAVDETRPPMIIGAHWIDHLDNEGQIAKCKPHDFKFEDEWLPLYTRAGVTKQVSGLSSLLNTQGDSPLIAVIPPDMLFQYEREYVIHQLHKAHCLAWVSIYYGKNQ